jgi:hypothetical protein
MYFTQTFKLFDLTWQAKNLLNIYYD